MNQKIFTLGLSVEATSLYLLMADLVTRVVDLEDSALTPLWMDSDEQYKGALEELKAHHVLVEIENKYYFRAPGEWIAASQS